MKILVLSALYPPYAFGGAEDCAQSFSQWAAANGHDVHVLMASQGPDDEGKVQSDGGVTISRVATPHVYPVSLFNKASSWQKPLWHIQDHIDGRAGPRIAKAAKAFAPDVIVIHYLQGFGYRTLEYLASLGIPIVYVLHDVGLACIQMSMFRNGRACASQCLACRASGAYKANLIKNASKKAAVGFMAPSQAIINTLDRFFPVKSYPHAQILNTKRYPVSEDTYQPSETLRLLYVGKLDENKGIDILLSAVEQLAKTRSVHLKIAGKGSLDKQLHGRYGAAPWASFLGFVTQETIADEMARADLLCVPSLCQENSPGVVIQALSAGVPVAATDRGGLPELVEEGRNGILLHRHDVDDWIVRLGALADDRAELTRLRAQTVVDRQRFNIDTIGAETITFLERIVAVGKDNHPAIAYPRGGHVTVT